MGIPCVIKPSGGMPVVVATNGFGTPMTEATNGFGIAVTEAANGLPVTGITFGPDVTAPIITSTNTVSNAEGTVLAHTLTANETVTWAIVAGGADNARFELSGATLRWLSNGTKNFEAPDDVGANNTYVVTVRATDTALNNSTTQTITVTVTDVTAATPPDAPVLDLLTDGTDNTPDFTLTGDLVLGDTVRFQYSTSAVFSGASETTNAIDAGEDAANEISFSTGALANNTWYFRARIERPGTEGAAISGWSNTETVTISVASASGTTWNPSDKTAGFVLSNVNRTVTYPSGGNTLQGIRSVAATVANQKVYIEHLITTMTASFFFGFATGGTGLTYEFGVTTPSTGFYFATANGQFRCEDSVHHTVMGISPDSVAVGDRMCLAFDTALGKAWIRKNNGVWNSYAGTGDPATNTLGATVTFAGPYYAMAWTDANNGDVFTTYFASGDWLYAAPSGYTQLAA